VVFLVSFEIKKTSYTVKLLFFKGSYETFVFFFPIFQKYMAQAMTKKKLHKQ